MTTDVTGLNRQWAGLDSNQRKLTLMGLQPIPFSHSGTDPNEKADSTERKPEYNKKIALFLKNGAFFPKIVMEIKNSGPSQKEPLFDFDP